MLLGVLAFAAVVLTYSMFQSRNSMLGFPSALMWAILGGYAYTQYTTVWDIYFLFAFACLLGMTPFSAFAAFALRTKKEDKQAGEEYIDEGGSESQEAGESRTEDTSTAQPGNGDHPSRRVRIVRSRAARRREQGVSHRTNYGEFK